MRTIRFRAVAAGVLAWLAMAGLAAAQNTARELSALQVIQYVSSGQPADWRPLAAAAIVGFSLGVVLSKRAGR